MGKVKGILIGLVVIVLILFGFFSFISDFIKWLCDAVKWIVFVDNAETGLSLQAEMIIKGIIEAIIIGIGLFIGISEKSPIITICSIVIGFLACLLIYAICKYIVIILVVAIILLGLFITFNILKNRKKNKLQEVKE